LLKDPLPPPFAKGQRELPILLKPPQAIPQGGCVSLGKEEACLPHYFRNGTRSGAHYRKGTGHGLDEDVAELLGPLPGPHGREDEDIQGLKEAGHLAVRDGLQKLYTPLEPKAPGQGFQVIGQGPRPKEFQAELPFKFGNRTKEDTASAKSQGSPFRRPRAFSRGGARWRGLPWTGR